MLRISFRATPEVISLLKRKGGQVVTVLQSKLSQMMFLLGAYVQREKLSGQMLTPRSGRLRGSVTVEPTVIEGTRITGRVSAASGVAFYGAIAEHGIVSPYEIIASKSRALAFLLNGKQTFAKSVSRKPVLPKPFMAQSLIENKTKILAELEGALGDLSREP